MSNRMKCPHCGGWIYMDDKLNGSCDTCNSKLVNGLLIPEDSNPDEDRTITLLRAAKALLLKQREAGILSDNAFTVHYDDADCDGYCLIDDITAEIDVLEEKPHGVSVQEHIDLEHELKEIKQKEKQLYNAILSYRKNLPSLHATGDFLQGGDAVLDGVIQMCHEFLSLDFAKESKVPFVPVEPRFSPFREFCPKCGYSHRVTLATLSKECPVCHIQMQKEDL